MSQSTAWNAFMLVPGDDAESLGDLTDHATALEEWDQIFACVLDTTLAAAGLTEPHVDGDLDLTGHGIAMVADLFLSGRTGVPIACSRHRLGG